MSINKKYEKLAKKFLSDEITETEKEALFSAAEKNQELKDLLKFHERLNSEKLSIEMADEKSFKEMRLKILGELNTIDKVSENKFDWIKETITGFFKRPVFNTILAVAMFALGYLANRPSAEFELVESISSTALQTKDLQSSINAPYIYQNASFKEQTNGLVKVSFDVSRHLEITRPKNDPLVQDILAQSLMSSNSVPQRLRSISNTNISMHPKIKQALIETMLNDSHPIVRQKSLSSLMVYKNDQHIQEALIHVLNNEESIYMRLAAIDYLSNNDVDLSLLEKKINTLDHTKNSAVNQKLRQLRYKPTEEKL